MHLERETSAVSFHADPARAAAIAAADRYGASEHGDQTAEALPGGLHDSARQRVPRGPAHVIGDDGVIRGPGGSGRLGPVARHDLLDSAAAVLAAGA
jgi:hypothetical protein